MIKRRRLEYLPFSSVVKTHLANCNPLTNLPDELGEEYLTGGADTSKNKFDVDQLPDELGEEYLNM